jgi:hypothetical protein
MCETRRFRVEDRESVLERGDAMAEPLLFREVSDPSVGV